MSEQENGVFVQHLPCPSCGSQDNLGLYLKETEDGDMYDASCFGCKAFFSHNQLVENGMLDADFKVDKSVLKAPKQRITREEYTELQERTNFSGKMSDGTQYRGLADWVLEFRHMTCSRPVAPVVRGTVVWNRTASLATTRQPGLSVAAAQAVQAIDTRCIRALSRSRPLIHIAAEY